MQRFGFALGAATVAAAASAEPMHGDPAAPLPPALEHMRGSGGHITYLGSVDGLEGYLVTTRRPDGTVLALPTYVLPGGEHVLIGHAHDSDGSDVTEMQTQRLKIRLEEMRNNAPPSPALDIGTPAPAAPRPASAAARAAATEFARQVRAQTASFHVGRPGAPVAYLLADPGAPDSERLGDMLRPVAAAGDIDLVVIATSSDADTEAAAVGLLSQPKIAMAWYSKAPPTRTPPTEEARAGLKGWIASNNAFARSLGRGASPLMAYIGADGEWTVRQGVPLALPEINGSSEKDSMR